MAEPRKITVEKDNPEWDIFARDVAITLWLNPDRANVLALSTEEAQILQKALTEFLEEPK